MPSQIPSIQFGVGVGVGVTVDSDRSLVVVGLGLVAAIADWTGGSSVEAERLEFHAR